MRKKTASVITAVLGVFALGTIFLSRSGREALPLSQVEHSKQTASKETFTPSGGEATQTVHILPKHPASPWDKYQPLTANEKEEFKSAEEQVRKFLTWGKMDPDAIPAFRQTLFKIGDRAIADLARGLSQISKEDIHDKASAEAVIHKIDALGYFANSQNSLAADSAAYLARRPIIWNESGKIVNPVEANITFEMFDIFSRYRPDEAAQFITTIDKTHRAAYFTHYAYGRKLAGKTMEEIDQELKAVFGSPELALQ